MVREAFPGQLLYAEVNVVQACIVHQDFVMALPDGVKRFFEASDVVQCHGAANGHVDKSVECSDLIMCSHPLARDLLFAFAILCPQMLVVGRQMMNPLSDQPGKVDGTGVPR